LMRQVREWIIIQCSREETTAMSRLGEIAAASFIRFRADVQTELGLRDGWTLSDVNAHYESKYMPRSTRECTTAEESVLAGNIESASNLKGIFIIGDLLRDYFALRQRDYVLRDLLGSIPSAHICIDLSDTIECASMLQYFQERRMYLWTCGPCEATEALRRDEVSILVTSFNAIANKDQRVLDLKESWRPRVIIHLNDEATSPSSSLRALYSGAHLVLRMCDP